MAQSAGLIKTTLAVDPFFEKGRLLNPHFDERGDGLNSSWQFFPRKE